MIFDRVNISKIFVRHFKTLYDYGELTWNGKNKMPLSDIFIFLIFPSILALVFVVLNIRINDFYVNLIITSFAIFIGLLFSFLTLVYQIVNKTKEQQIGAGTDQKLKAKFQLVKELFVNIAFAIALSLLCIISILLTRLNPAKIIHYLKNFEWYNTIKLVYLDITNFLSYFLIVEFVLVLMMILKRFFLVFDTEFK
jgi:hypothetical protein